MAETCYRHPGRETRVSCSNCGRPICPDCMTPTPVGMRCPECASQTTPVRKLNSGRAGLGRAPATMVLIGLNVAAFIAEIASGSGGLSTVGGTVFRHGALYGPAVANGDYWRLVTSGFLHAGLIHIAFNMYALYILGNLLEPAIGTPRYVALYFTALLAGSAGALILDPNVPTIGASGAVFGLMAAAFIIARRRGMGDLANQIGFFVVINLVFTFSASNISVGGHLGGLLTGAIIAFVFVEAERRRPSLAVELGVMAALAVASVAISLAVV